MSNLIDFGFKSPVKTNNISLIENFKGDKLDIMMKMQKELQEKLAVKKFGKLEFNQEYINNNMIALVDELFEALRETPFKYWKKNQQLNIEAARKEAIDSFHFFMNFLIGLGIDSEMLYKMYCEKNKINHDRIKEGY